MGRVSGKRARARVRVTWSGSHGQGHMVRIRDGVRQATLDLVADELDEIRRERVRASVLRDAPQRRGKDLVRVRARVRARARARVVGLG